MLADVAADNLTDCGNGIFCSERYLGVLDVTCSWNVATDALATSFQSGSRNDPCGTYALSSKSLSQSGANAAEAIVHLGTRSESLLDDWTVQMTSPGAGPVSCLLLGSSGYRCCTDDGQVGVTRLGTYPARETLCYATSFDTVAAALERGGVGTGSSCRTTTGTIGTTSARSTTALAVTGPRSVVATIPITGLTASTDYIVTVKINRYTAGGGSYVDFVYDTIEFTAGGTTEDIEYDVPVNTDYDYEIDTSYEDIAAA